MREDAATKEAGPLQLRKVRRAELEPRAVVSGSNLLAAADSFSWLADSVTNSIASVDQTWLVFWAKLNLIFLGTFVACALTNTRGKGREIGVIVILVVVTFGIAAVPSEFFRFADNFGKAFLLVVCLGAVAWPLVLGRYLGEKQAAWKFSAALLAFEVICLLAMLHQTHPTL